MPRHDFSAADNRLLAERVGFHCSNPSCGVATIGPSEDPTKKEYVGVAAHIYSASVHNGPRANSALTEQERRSPNNGIHLCNKCSTIIDKNNGSGYPADILFNWKRSAESAAKARIYKGNSYTLFKRVDFSNLEKQYSTALTCSGLNDKNVVSCPANKAIITEISNKLRLANKCVLKGVSGSGKSLLTYQTAYEFHKNGWSIFNLDKELISDSTVLAAPQEKSLVVIDDAQIIEFRHLERILKESYSNCIVLANWNSSTSFDSNLLRTFPCVDVSPSSQVELLKTYCLNNKQSIASSLNSIGIKTNNKDYHTRIETRIDRASKEKTPWLFNYHLTEGWNAAQNDLKFLRDDEQMDLVIVTVAAYQFATLDYGVNEEIVLSSLRNFHDNPLWLSKTRRILSEYCQIKDGTVKNKHYEYSRKVLKIFTSQTDSKEEALYLIGVFKRILKSSVYEKGHSNILEFIMFDFRWCQHELNREGFIDEISNELLASSEDLDASPAKIKKLNSLIRFNKNVLNTLELNKKTLEIWMFSCSRDTAYSLGNLFNTLYNEKYSHFPSSKSLVDFLLGKTISSDIEDKSRFSYMLNRTHLLLNNNEKAYANDQLLSADFNVDVSQYSSSNACYQFSSLINDLSCINTTWANQQIKNNIDGIANLLNNNLMETYRGFKDLIDTYFGVIPAILGINNRDPELTKIGKELSNKIQADAILKAFELVEAIDVQDYTNLLIFMTLYNKPKLKLVSEGFNYTRLRSLYKGDSKLDRNHRGLICILHNHQSQNYMNYLSQVIVGSNFIDRVFISLNPELSLDRLKSGIAYKSKYHDCSECEEELLILKFIMDEEGETLAKRMLRENEDEISKSIFSESINIDDKKGKFDLLIFIHLNFPDILKNIFSDQEKNIKMLKKITRLLKGKKHEKNIARLYIFLIKIYSPVTIQKIFEIEKRYPSVKKFDIRKYFN